MAKTKAQTEYAQKYFKDNPGVEKLWANPKGEFFTDLNWANNSLEKEENGKIKGKLEVFDSKTTPEDESK